MLQVFSDMPAECDTLQWICLGNAEHAMFIPSWSGITDVIDTYKTSQYMNYDPSGAYWKCKRVATIAEQNRELLGDSVKKVIATYETMAYNRIMDNKATVKARYADDGRAAGDAYVTQMADTMAGCFFDQADKLYEDLMYHMMWYTGKTTPPALDARINLQDVADACGYTLTHEDDTYTLAVGAATYTFTVGNAFYLNDATQVDYDSKYLTNILYQGDLYVPMSFVAKAKLVTLSAHCEDVPKD